MQGDASTSSAGDAHIFGPESAPRWFRAESLGSEELAWLHYVAPWLLVGDPLADAVFGELRANGLGLSDEAAHLAALCGRADAPEAALALRAELQCIPAWVDFDLMRHGAAMARRNFPALLAALTYGALPLVFSHPNSAAVFLSTGHFEASIPRRLNESAALFLGVTDSDGLRPLGRAWETCLHVRLIHAAVRCGLLASPSWPQDRFGIPINALQMAAGPAFFGTAMLRSMRAMGARITPREAAGHCMTWRYVTYLLGAPSELIAETQHDQDSFDAQLMQLAFQPDDAGRHMLTVLLDGLVAAPRTRILTRPQQAAMMRAVLGDDWADKFGLPRSEAHSLRTIRAAFALYGRIAASALAARATEAIGRRVLAELARAGLIAPNA